MPQAVYYLNLHVNGGDILPKICHAEIPPGYNVPDLPLGKQHEIIDSFTETTLRSCQALNCLP